jgi:hypothetical protein
LTPEWRVSECDQLSLFYGISGFDNKRFGILGFDIQIFGILGFDDQRFGILGFEN